MFETGFAVTTHWIIDVPCDCGCKSMRVSLSSVFPEAVDADNMSLGMYLADVDGIMISAPAIALTSVELGMEFEEMFAEIVEHEVMHSVMTAEFGSEDEERDHWALERIW